MNAPTRLVLTVAWTAMAVWLVLRRGSARRGRPRLPPPLPGASSEPGPDASGEDALASSTAPGRRRLALVAAEVLLALVTGPALAAVLAGVAVGWPRWRRARRQQQSIEQAWARAPDVVTLVHLAVTSGLTPYLAVAEVAELAGSPFGDGFRRVLDDVHGGQRLPDALERLAGDLGEPARPLVAALSTSERYGVPLLPALEAAAVELRRRRRQAAEARARRLPVLLSFPLVCCVLPAFVCLSIAPIAVSALRSLPAPTSTVVSRSSSGSPPAPSLPGGPP